MEKIIASFINDENKMKDFKILSKKEFLESYSYINSESYDLTLKKTRILKRYLKELILYIKYGNYEASKKIIDSIKEVKKLK
jgi:hypothetical protein